ncbi:unnamed protein product [Lampetra fluviatilis]
MDKPGVGVAAKDSALLPCRLGASSSSSAASSLSVFWAVTPLHEPRSPEQVLIFHRGRASVTSARYAGRAAFLAPRLPAPDASMVLNGTRDRDAGTYVCVAARGGALEMAGGALFVVALSVLVPPSQPECRVLVPPALGGGNATLSCSSDEGTPTPTYSWGGPGPAGGLPPLASTSPTGATLWLGNVSARHGGSYSCTASNAIGAATCSLRLHVSRSPAARRQRGGGGVGSLLLLLFLLLALRLHVHRRRVREDDCPNDILEDDSPPTSSPFFRLLSRPAAREETPIAADTSTPLAPRHHHHYHRHHQHTPLRHARRHHHHHHRRAPISARVPGDRLEAETLNVGPTVGPPGLSSLTPCGFK